MGSFGRKRKGEDFKRRKIIGWIRVEILWFGLEKRRTRKRKEIKKNWKYKELNV
jgi:hypothetical protein